MIFNDTFLSKPLDDAETLDPESAGGLAFEGDMLLKSLFTLCNSYAS
jgi:hypothetical protein